MHFTRLLKTATTTITSDSSLLTGRPKLIELYKQTLTLATRLPSTSVYRQSLESVTSHRLSIIEANEDVKVIEEEIGAGELGELVLQAKKEMDLFKVMEKGKPWEELEVVPPKDQWVYEYTKK